jgi:hypothetical protein
MHLVFLAPLPFTKQLVPFVKHFVKDVVDIFGDVYLRAPNAQDIARLVSMNSARGFLDMLGSIDACTGDGTSVQQLAEGHRQGIRMGQP